MRGGFAAAVAVALTLAGCGRGREGAGAPDGGILANALLPEGNDAAPQPGTTTRPAQPAARRSR